MAFRRTTSKTFSADVKVPVANSDQPGGYEINTFKAIFSHADNNELERLRAEIAEQPTALEGQKLLAKRKLVGWELIDAETKESVPFTPENLDALLLIPPTPLHISIAFWETVNGARAKNL